MKKSLVFLITLFLIVSTFSVFAAEKNNAELTTQLVSQKAEYYEDGTYAVITITQEVSKTTRGTVYNTSGSKSYVHIGTSGEELFRFTVHGTFTVTTGVNAMCTASSYSVNIFNDAWSNKSASTYEYSNQAIGNATFIKKVLFVTTDTETPQVILSCDANGQLS